MWTFRKNRSQLNYITQALNDLPHFSHGDAVRTDKMTLIEPKSKDKKDTQDKAEVSLVSVTQRLW